MVGALKIIVAVPGETFKHAETILCACPDYICEALILYDRLQLVAEIGMIENRELEFTGNSRFSFRKYKGNWEFTASR